MSMGTLVIIILVVMAVGAFPNWGYSRSWGHGPSGLLGFVLVIVVVLMLTGHLT